ncbi:MAG: hypothetical protein HFJ47_00040 [Clostridia bacterium]|nr:hypothetical protein [Clostridia bacterium]
MGLDVYAKGLAHTDCYHCGYITFNIYREKVAKAYNEKIGELYKKILRNV